MSGCKYTVKHLYEHSLQVRSYPGDKIYSVWQRFPDAPRLHVCSRRLQPPRLHRFHPFRFPFFYFFLSSRFSAFCDTRQATTRVPRRDVTAISPPSSFSKPSAPLPSAFGYPKVRPRKEIATFETGESLNLKFQGDLLRSEGWRNYTVNL